MWWPRETCARVRSVPPPPPPLMNETRAAPPRSKWSDHHRAPLTKRKRRGLTFAGTTF